MTYQGSARRLDMDFPQPASPEEYRKAAIVMTDWAIKEDAVDDLPMLLEMIGFPDGRAAN